MTSLDEKIEVMLMCLREFCQKENIELMKINSARKSYYAFSLLNLEKTKRELLSKIILLLDLRFIYGGLLVW